MAAALRVAACQTDSGAFTTYDAEIVLLGESVGFEGLNTGAHFDSFAGVACGIVVFDREGFEVVRPEAEGAFTCRFSKVAIVVALAYEG